MGIGRVPLHIAANGKTLIDVNSIAGPILVPLGVHISIKWK